MKSTHRAIDQRHRIRSICFIALIAIVVVFYLIVGNTWKNPGLPVFSQTPEKVVDDINVANAISQDPLSQSALHPTRIVIKKIGVNAHVEPVGITASGNMSVPKKFENVGWYKYGVYPGEKGSAVIAGHLDNAAGKSLVFYNLKNLEEGDVITILDESNKELNFTVSYKKIVDYNNAPLEEIFGQDDVSRLNLITCDGVWLSDKKTYSKRLIVFAERI